VPPEATHDAMMAELQEKATHVSGHAITLVLDKSIRGDKTGGTGIRFNWSAVEPLDIQVILAGGISPDNVAEARLVVGAMGLDVPVV
jgi:phosphoribosylanthranilate isomerase